MDYVRFGETGLRVSRFSLGTMSLGTPAWKSWVADEAASIPVLKKALDLGINCFDTADWYSKGVSEQVVGRTLLKLSARDALVFCTKLFYPIGDDPNDRGLSRKHIIASIDRSLRNLGTDYVDIYMVHAFDPDVRIEETMEALHDLVKAGKARYIAASTMYAWQFCKMNYLARLHGWTPFSGMQCQVSLLYREEEREMIPYCRDDGIGVMAFSALARGLLSGVKSVRSGADQYIDEFFGDPIDKATAGRVIEVAERHGVAPSTIAYSWAAHHPGIDTVLVGTSSPEHLETAVAAAAFQMPEGDRLYLEELYRPRDVINDYNPVRRPRALPA